MKAYIARNKQDDDAGSEIIFANTVKEARSSVDESLLGYPDYIDVEVRRYPLFDGMENLSERELSKEKWRNGWRWFDYNDMPNEWESTDEEFYNWYNKHFKENSDE